MILDGPARERAVEPARKKKGRRRAFEPDVPAVREPEPAIIARIPDEHATASAKAQLSIEACLDQRPADPLPLP